MPGVNRPSTCRKSQVPPFSGSRDQNFVSPPPSLSLSQVRMEGDTGPIKRFGLFLTSGPTGKCRCDCRAPTETRRSSKRWPVAWSSSMEWCETGDNVAPNTRTSNMTTRSARATVDPCASSPRWTQSCRARTLRISWMRRTILPTREQRKGTQRREENQENFNTSRLMMVRVQSITESLIYVVFLFLFLFLI